MTIADHDEPAVTSRRERPRPSDIKQLFERYRRASRHVDDAERPATSWPDPAPDAEQPAPPHATKP